MPTAKKKSASKRAAAEKAPKAAKTPSRPKASTTKSVRLGFSVDCLECMAPMVVEAVRSTLRCRACLATVDVTKILWSTSAKSSVAGALRGNTDRETHFDHEGMTVITRVRSEAPRCGHCGEGLDVDPTRESCTCACGATTPIRAADALVKTVNAKAIAVVGERPGADVVPVEPVAFRCECGARLATDGTSRSITCEGCKVHIDVPEGLWNAIHPVLSRPAMYLLLGGAR